jgi:hypothetical protein
MRFCRRENKVSVVSVSEVFHMFVLPDGESTARNISEWHKIMPIRRFVKGKYKGRNRKIIISSLLKEILGLFHF